METLDLQLGSRSGSIRPQLFGHFIEFIENCIQGGIYDPGSPSSDEHGLRQDVLEKAQALRPTLLRWPGGTYSAVYHWQDSVGPISERKKRKNLIWGGINDAAFGTCEFIEYCRKLGAEPMISINIASGTAQEAADWVEYCNGEPGTYYADLRVKHGYPEPFNVKYWCIGNECAAEPDLGPQHVPERYISDAWEFTKHMKLTDPTIKLVFVGDGNNMAWNKKILEAMHPVCDYFSVHHYSGKWSKGLYGPFESLSRFEGMLNVLIPTIAGYSLRNEPFNKWYRFPRREGDIKLIIDEWNIWSSTPMGENNRYGVKMVYSWRDALWTACMMNLFARKSRYIGAANLAQMVNVLAPILTAGDKSYVQTTFHVLKLYRDMLEGENIECLCDLPTLEDDYSGSIQYVNLCAVDIGGGKTRVFAVNLSQTQSVRLKIAGASQATHSYVLSAEGFESVNTLDHETVTHTEKDGEEALVLAPATVNIIEL